MLDTYGNYIDDPHKFTAQNVEGGDITITNGVFKTVQFQYNKSAKRIDFTLGDDDTPLWAVLMTSVKSDDLAKLQTRGIFVLEASGGITEGDYVAAAVDGKVKTSATAAPTRAKAMHTVLTGEPVMIIMG